MPAPPAAPPASEPKAEEGDKAEDGRPGLLGCAIAAASRVLNNEAMQARAK
jgi:hypothetical protein